MKKFLRILCISLLAFSLSACEKATSEEGGAKTEDLSVGEEIAESGTDFVEEAVEKEAQGSQTVQEEAKLQVTESEIDLNAAFEGINGCAVIYLPAQGRYLFFHEAMCREEASPYSTFKIISALAGLQNGVIADEFSTMNYDGTDYGNPEWNEALTLEQAFQKSCVWYFREVIDAVGNDEMQKELDALPYGNCDISEWDGSNINPLPSLNGFWLDSSLRISPLEQVQVLEKIFEGQSDYNSNNIELLKSIMLTDEDGTQRIYGKTGSSGNGEAWFVGFAETAGKRKYFAVYLDDREQKDQVSGNKAKEIALEIVK